MSDRSIQVSDLFDREVPPMPVAVTVGATVRNDQPVAVLRFRDVEGEELLLHLSPATVLDLQVQLAKFSLQVHGKN
jgi:hypothetical protein